ncbi:MULTISPECIES: lipopolysaccharide heptosyltransferase II [unclassified Leptolyngbya]|uniref:lipopolysaccharide heptosyltransferase II n=1 Tax=unclassified Leptolyngbya TaxID=2650499 RepID=UPI00168A175B|nr:MULTISPECIES: lipopolysaccharide heptosyltransferase II [unclassified Leptolyngbya]MBD1909204.1 lipopolysaccharide heptosyltransferase II [Leptolyngbya sp. FACHB-8]MBD2153993.1 lipopolysaccharide heptosyltransferase II [Leptolyngbya sp. FACHB-16]
MTDVTWEQDWAAAKRILCIRLDSLGDMVMTTPALNALKAANPERHLTLMTSTAGAAISAHLPMIDEVMVYEAPWLKATAPRQNSQPEFEMVEVLRDRAFDAAIIFTVYSQNPLPSAFMCYMADIPLRLAHCRENPYQLLTHVIRDPEPEQFTRHEVQRQLDLVASIGAHPVNGDTRLTIATSPLAECRIALRLRELGLTPDRPWIVIHPGATAPSRRYAPERFAEVGRSLHQQGITAVFTGSAEEQELVESIRQQMEVPSISLVGQLDIPDLIALLQAAPLLLCNNTGPVHLAAALGTPVVDLYALTNLQHTPWQVPHRVLYHDVPCRICYRSICPEGHHHCLELVTPDQVVTAILELLAETSASETSVSLSPHLV